MAIGSWDKRAREDEEIGTSIYRELIGLGHRAEFFRIDGGEVPVCDIVFLWGPRGRFLHVLEEVHRRRPRPKVVLWNTEGLPDLRLPWLITKAGAKLRLLFGRMGPSHLGGKCISENFWFRTLDRRGIRFDFLGQYLEAMSRGWVDAFFDISEVYAKILSQEGLRVQAVPFGTMPGTYAEMGIERDIDVLWMGKRATRRRSRMLDRLRSDLEKRGIGLLVVDGEEHPFVFGDERTQLLNRSKITLNLLRTWYDENSLRFCLAAPNRSLIVSESLLRHVSSWQPGRHYVAAHPGKLADTISDYLANEEERQRIVEAAFQLSTSTLTFRKSIATIMGQLESMPGQAEELRSQEIPSPVSLT